VLTRTVLTRTVLTRTTTLRAAVGHNSSGANRGRSPPRTPAGLRNRPTGATRRTLMDLRALPTTSRRATAPCQGARAPPSPDPESAPLTRRGRAPPGRWESTKAHHLKKATPHDHLDTFRSLNDTRTTPNDRKHQACVITKNRGHHIYQQPTETVIRESAGSGFDPRLVCFGGPAPSRVLTDVVRSPKSIAGPY
jgi:hypothetical protein